VLDVNLLGVCRTVDAALPEIVRRAGHVVVISSIYAFTNGVGAIPYAMSKAAVEQFGRALRIELLPHGASASGAYFGFIDTEMVHQAIDRDPLATEMLAAFPKPLHKRLAPSAAGEAIARGIERRQARIIRPHRWVLMSVLRGVLGPLADAQAERDETALKLIRALDGRAGEDQPLRA
jgi:NAD(P)-dependent dehydrogenase (short-subunit alcohol dehydrogenase family)